MYIDLLNDLLNVVACLTAFQGFTLIVCLIILFVIFIYEINRRD